MLYDFECVNGHVTEKMTRDRVIACPVCGEPARRIISIGKVYCGNQDTAWLKDVIEVVDKESLHGKEFIKNPTRDNYRKWMREEGLRPLERGEKPRQRQSPDLGKMADKIFNHLYRL